MTTSRAKLAGLALIAALCAAVLLGLTAPAWAGLDEAVAAYQRGDYASAFREFRPLAEQGNANAQYNLGIMYDNGQGVSQDYAGAGLGRRSSIRLRIFRNSSLGTATSANWKVTSQADKPG